jgi:hypothetical protein
VDAVVIYESMYGNTRTIAKAIADGLRSAGDVELVHVSRAHDALNANPDVVVVGGPTHAHSMTRPSTRKAAATEAEKPGSDLRLEPEADGSGVRELLESVGTLDAHAAAFDTRVEWPAWLSGRASKGIGRALRQAGASLLVKPESFLVTKDTRLVPGEIDRARRWGESLGHLIAVRGGQVVRGGRAR